MSIDRSSGVARKKFDPGVNFKPELFTRFERNRKCLTPSANVTATAQEGQVIGDLASSLAKMGCFN
jgi:hypothetical protein